MATLFKNILRIANDNHGTFIAGSAPPTKPRPEVVNAKHMPTEDKSKHQAKNSSKPVWLLALEIVTGTMIGVVFVVALFTATRKWRRKPSISIPWKKSSSSKDYMTVLIG